ncbi:MAG: hypothetical protein LUQ22_00395 [Methanotrichaceae archaeon]|nr:hypothetical protein [Methanotrichaceae archaeon]
MLEDLTPVFVNTTKKTVFGTEIVMITGYHQLSIVGSLDDAEFLVQDALWNVV